MLSRLPAKPAVYITKNAVDDELPRAKDRFLWDSKVPGFGLKVTPAGRKVYVFQYRLALPGQAERTPARGYIIGQHGSWTPDKARKRAKELAALVDRGICPKEQEEAAQSAKLDEVLLANERARQESELVFEKIADIWLNHYEY